jgi:hypothetical protein
MSSPSKYNARKALTYRLDSLIKHEEFIQQARLANEDQYEGGWYVFLDRYKIHPSLTPVIITYLNTGELNYDLIDPPGIHITELSVDLLTGEPLSPISKGQTLPRPAVAIILDPLVNKTFTQHFIAAQWDKLIEPKLNVLRRGPLPSSRQELAIKRKQLIMDLSKTMTPREIAIELNMTSHQVSKIKYREKKKYTPPNT